MTAWRWYNDIYMRTRAILFSKTIVLTVIALAVAAFLIVRPALAQEDASSSAIDDNSSTSTDLISSESTSTQLDTSIVEPAASDSSGDPTTDTTDTSSDNSSPTAGTTSDSAAADTSTTPDSDSVTDASSSAISVEQPPVGLTEVHIIGTKYTDYFTDGTTTTAYPGDPKIDSNFDKPDAPIPMREGLTWVHTIGDNLYDTPSGDLEVGTYALQGNGHYVQNAPPFVSSTSTVATTSSSSDESNSVTSPEVLGASTSSDTTSSSSDASAATTSSTDTSADASRSGQSDTVDSTEDASSSNAQTDQ
jgi:hypothetical protein